MTINSSAVDGLEMTIMHQMECSVLYMTMIRCLCCQRGKTYEQMKAELGEKNLPIKEVRTVRISSFDY